VANTLNLFRNGALASSNGEIRRSAPKMKTCAPGGGPSIRKGETPERLSEVFR
jgi:hypothetical protein